MTEDEKKPHHLIGHYYEPPGGWPKDWAKGLEFHDYSHNMPKPETESGEKKNAD